MLKNQELFIFVSYVNKIMGLILKRKLKRKRSNEFSLNLQNLTLKYHLTALLSLSLFLLYFIYFQDVCKQIFSLFFFNLIF